MHIPNHMVSGMVIPATAAAGAAGIAAAAYLAAKSESKPDSKLFAAITALIFTAQMMNFPVQSGTSGHLAGTTLAVLLLGPSFGILSIAMVLTAQTFFFSDGGIMALGANILNMALIGAVPGILMHWYFTRKKNTDVNSLFRHAAAGFAAWLSVMLSAFACTLELSFSGIIPFIRVFPAMMGIHALIGAGEAAITVALFIAVRQGIKIEESVSSINKLSFPVVSAVTAAAAITALFLSPLASGFPDGLEWVAEKFHVFKEPLPFFMSPFPDYNVSFIGNEYFATGFAGLTGVLIVFVFAWGTGKLAE